MTYINRRFSHEKRVVHLDTGDPTLTLDYNFLLNSGSTIEQSVILGPQLTFTRASDARSFDSSGNLVAVGGNDLPRYEHDPTNNNAQLGLLMEATRTNEALWNQDITNAVWVKTNMTNAMDATGLDGVANSASTITASAANATVLQTVTKASADNTYSVWVRRVTGSGNIDITDNNGTNWITLTGLSSTVFTRYVLPPRIAANPVFGIRIVTDTDAVEVDMNQLEEGDLNQSYALSEIPTTTASVTRAQEFARTTDVSWVANTDAMTWYSSQRTKNITERGNTCVFHLVEPVVGDLGVLMRCEGFVSVGQYKTLLLQAGGNAFMLSTNGAEIVDTLHKCAWGYDVDSEWLAFDGAIQDTTLSNTFLAETGYIEFNVGVEDNDFNSLNGYVQEIKHWIELKTQAFGQAETS